MQTGETNFEIRNTSSSNGAASITLVSDAGDDLETDGKFVLKINICILVVIYLLMKHTIYM